MWEYKNIMWDITLSINYGRGIVMQCKSKKITETLMWLGCVENVQHILMKQFCNTE